MPDKEFIKYLIHEEIYVINQDKTVQKDNFFFDNTYENINQIEKQIVSEKTIPQVVLPVYKKILIIVADTTDNKLNIKDKKYIAKILQAVKVDLYQTTLINILHETLGDLTGIEKILAFTPNHQIDIVSSPYKITDYQGAKFLVADSLSDIALSVELRKKLWVELQVMFS